MKKTVLSLPLLIIATSVSAADGKRLPITVRSSSIQNRTVIVDARHEGKSFELECQQQRDDCKLLPSGHYTMERLRGSGVYMDCENANVYAESAVGKDEKKLGEYCLLQDPE